MQLGWNKPSKVWDAWNMMSVSILKSAAFPNICGAFAGILDDEKILYLTRQWF